jgi:hypothetical protein
MPITAETMQDRTGYMPGSKLDGVGRCPHCAIASPNMNLVWADVWVTTGGGWAAYRCNSCSSIVAVLFDWRGGKFTAEALWPDAKAAHEDIPEPARTFLQQAYETLHAPDAAAVMAGSAVDGMLKAKGLEKGSLYERIDLALAQNILTQGMADWAHSVRLGSNRPRHSDKDKPHVSPQEAQQSVEFAEALGSFLFVLTAKINKGIEAAESASG